MEADTSVTHLYLMNDASGCTSLFDSVTATALPSPVPLPTGGSDTGGACGAPSISNDAETSVEFSGGSTTSFLAPTSIFPASGDFTIGILVESAMGGGSPANFCILGVDDANPPSFWEADKVNAGGIFAGGVHTIGFEKGNSSVDPFDVANGYPMYIVYTNSGTTSTLYLNGQIANSGFAITPAYTNGTDGELGRCNGGGSYGGRISKFYISNIAETQATIYKQTAALGL
jgi:hypothetical protein